MRRRFAIVVVLGLIALDGCGGDDEGGGTPSRAPGETQADEAATPGRDTAEQSPTRSDRQAVRETVRKYLQAIGNGDGAAACDVLTEESAARVPAQVKGFSEEVQGDTCDETITAFSAFYGESLDNPKVMNIKVSGDKATAVGPLDEQAKLVKLDGEWKIEQYGD